MQTLTNDPTKEFIAALKDPSKYRVKKNVPIFLPHTKIVRNKDNKVVREIKVTPKDLPAIAEKTRNLIETYGFYPTIGIGHRIPGLDEKQQPDIVGHFANIRVGTYGPKDLPCILADEYIAVEHYAEASKYPHRSPEYYPPDSASRNAPETVLDAITGLALLKSDPFMQMGIVNCGSQAQPELYSIASYAMGEAPDQDNQLLADLGAPQGEGAGGANGEPEGYGAFKANFDHHTKQTPWMNYAMSCYDAANPGGGDMSGNSPAAGGNANIPTTEKEPKETPAVNFSNETAAVHYAALERKVADQEKLIRQLVRERDLTSCQSEVRQLIAENYAIDPQEELTELLNMPADKRPAYLAKIRKRYSKVESATGGGQEMYGLNIPVFNGEAVEAPRVPSNMVRKDESDAAVKLASQRGISFTAALGELRNGQGKV